MIIETIALGNSDLAGDDYRKPRTDLADDANRFTGCKGAKFAEPAYPFDFQGIERGKYLIVAIAKRLHLQGTFGSRHVRLAPEADN